MGNEKFRKEISYFSKQIKGSDSYWRSKRNELYTWIAYHIEKGNGAPNFFCTLSCAEYYWQDIFRLIEERIKLETNENVHFEFTKENTVQVMNDYTGIVQSYFQKRVNIWLKTVGTKILGINHYWLRYEFAPSRGQNHAHFLAICKDKRILLNLHQNKHDKTKMAELLANYAEKMKMFASFPTNQAEIRDKDFNATTLRCKDVEDIEKDIAQLLLEVQIHKCSDYCLRSKLSTNENKKQ